MRFSYLIYYPLWVLFLLSSFTTDIYSQDTIHLKNPSFEGFPRMGFIGELFIDGWEDTGFAGESAADLQPGNFEVATNSVEGHTYLGMVTRDNGTFESIGQLIEKPLLKDQCYQFSVALCKSGTYMSPTKRDTALVNFDGPIVLKIWGLLSKESMTRELLGTSDPIESEHWHDYQFEFKPNLEVSFIKLEAFYVENYHKPYNGNLLMDFCSPIIPIENCGENTFKKERIESSDRKPKERSSFDRNGTKPKVITAKTIFGDPFNEKPTYLEFEDSIKALGRNIEFKENSASLKESSLEYLNSIQRKLAFFPYVRLKMVVNNNEKEDLVYNRIEELKSEFAKVNFPEKNYQITHKLKKKDKILTENEDLKMVIRFK